MPLHALRALLLFMLLLTSMVACKGGGSGGSPPSPVITSAFGAADTIVVISDGQTIVAQVTATHPDPMETLTFRIDGGADRDLFVIDPATGLLELMIAPSYAAPADANADNRYEVRVVVRASNGATDRQTISVAVAFLVDTLADVVDGDLTVGNRSLREAIDYVNPGEAVSFAGSLSGQTLVLAAAQIPITKSIMIDGDLDNDGVPDITIDANSLSRIFDIDDGSGMADLDVRLSGLFLSNGLEMGPGGAIRNAENLSVVECGLLDNAAMGSGGDGGAISSGPGDLTVQGSVVGRNSSAGGDGGGIAQTGGFLTIVSSRIAENTAGDQGGGVYYDSGSVGTSGERLIIRKTDIDDNSALIRGGGIAVRKSGFLIEQSTIRYNEATASSGYGGGFFSATSGSKQLGTIINSTIHGNSAGRDGAGGYILFNRVRILNSTITSNMGGGMGGGILCEELDPDFGSRVEFTSSIVASNSPTDIDFDTFFTGLNPIRSGGGNVIGFGNATAGFGGKDMTGVANPLLDNLDDYGGETPTRPPLPGSPAIDFGRNPEGLDSDQRGATRTFGAATDAGSVERNDTD